MGDGAQEFKIRVGNFTGRILVADELLLDLHGKGGAPQEGLAIDKPTAAHAGLSGMGGACVRWLTRYQLIHGAGPSRARHQGMHGLELVSDLASDLDAVAALGDAFLHHGELPLATGDAGDKAAQLSEETFPVLSVGCLFGAERFDVLKGFFVAVRGN